MVSVMELKKARHIMVLNNNLDSIDMRDDSLKQDGFVTLIAEDEEEAIHMLDNILPDIVILETVTADRHSLELLDMIKRKTKAPVIIITPDGEIDTLKAMFDHGADDLIKTPVNSRILMARIHAILRRWYHFHKELIIHGRRIKPYRSA
jgi:two-component system, OmpR family, response regulator AdeR